MPRSRKLRRPPGQEPPRASGLPVSVMRPASPAPPLPRATIAGSPCNGYVRRRKASAVAAALPYKHAARRGSTITSVGRSSPHTQLRCVDAAAARAPTPAALTWVCTKTAAWAPTSYAPAATERPWLPSVAQAQVIAAAAHLTSGLWISRGPLRRMRWRLPGRARSHIRGGDLGAAYGQTIS
jgi:hypothetical protein